MAAAENLAKVESATAQCAALWADLERQARREARSVPSEHERHAARQSFWAVMAAVDSCDIEESSLRSTVQGQLHPWLMRSAFWHRAYAKPHGYAGDYRMVEWMYDLERDGCDDPTRSFAENLGADLFASVHSVQGVWHRRGLFADRVRAALEEVEGTVRVLDVACGGSRYLHDVAAGMAAPSRLHATLVDQDPAALAFATERLRDAGARVTPICTKVASLTELSLGGPFDLAMSTGLFDYLTDAQAEALLATMRARTTGTVTLCNFSPDDRSRRVKDLVVDWILVYRTAQQLASLSSDRAGEIKTALTPDRGLAYATFPGAYGR